MKQQDNEYEVIVMGSGLGGLVTGTWLSKNNHQVLLLKENRYHPTHTKGGYRFSPFSNFSERLIKITLLNKIFQELNLPPIFFERKKNGKKETGLEKTKEKVAFQVILPKVRIDLFYNRSMLQREWRREFQEEIDQIKNFYDEMDRIQKLFKTLKTEEGPESLFPIRSRSPIKRWFSFDSLPKGRLDENLFSFSNEFKKFIQLQLISWGNLLSDRLPISLVHYLLSHDELDDRVTDINLEELQRKIFEKFFQYGGRVEEVEGVERMDLEWRKGFTLSLKEEQRVLRSKFLVFNGPLQSFSNILSKREKLLMKWRQKIKPQYVLIPCFSGIREKVVPVGMRDLLVSIFDLEKSYEGGNLLFIALSPKGDENQAPEGKRALTVQSLIPFGKWDQDYLAKHQTGVMRHLYHLFPFLEKYIEFADWGWANDQLFCWSYPHFLYDTNYDFRWREGVVPTRIAKNLYFIGKENFPYMGLEGEVLSGLMVAKEISKKYH